MAMIDGRFARVDINIVDLGDQSELLKRVSAELPVNLPNAFTLPGNRQVSLQCKSGLVIAWTELSKVRIQTVYTITDDGTRYPLFRAAPVNVPPEHEAAYDFEPGLARMRMFFTVSMKWTGKEYLYELANLICKAPKRKEIFRPPLPNIFGDARLCMGNGYTNKGPNLADVFAHALSHFETSKWNADAMEGLSGDMMRAMYSFKDNKQVPLAAEHKWWEWPPCHAVNTMHYGELPIV